MSDIVPVTSDLDNSFEFVYILLLASKRNLQPRQKQIMELDEEAQEVVRELGSAINSAIENNPRVAAAIDNLREVGYELQLTLKLEIGLREIGAEDGADEAEPWKPEKDLKFELTDEDLRTLKRMKIRLDPEE